MYLQLVHRSSMPEKSVTWYTILPCDDYGRIRRTTTPERRRLQALALRIQAMAHQSLGANFCGIEYNGHEKTIELCFQIGIGRNQQTKKKFEAFRGWLALFSEEIHFIHDLDTITRIGNLVRDSQR